MWHHVIPRHEWRKRFGNLVGYDCSENRVELTTEQHSHVHELLYELNRSPFDQIAYRAIRGMIGQEEANKQASSVANTGNKYNIGHKNALGSKRTEEWKAKYGKKNVPRILKPYVNGFQGKTHTAESRARTGAATAISHKGAGNPNYGKVASAEKKLKISESLKEFWIKKKVSPPGRAA